MLIASIWFENAKKLIEQLFTKFQSNFQEELELEMEY